MEAFGLTIPTRYMTNFEAAWVRTLNTQTDNLVKAELNLQKSFQKTNNSYFSIKSPERSFLRKENKSEIG